MASFTHQVFNRAIEFPANTLYSLSGLDVSVLLEATSAWNNTTNAIPASVFTGLTGSQIHALSANSLFAKQNVYYYALTAGKAVGTASFTGTQWNILSTIYTVNVFLSSHKETLTGAVTNVGLPKAGDYHSAKATEIVAVLYNGKTGLSNGTVLQIIPDSAKMWVSNAYHGAQFAVRLRDGATSLFMVNSAVTTVQLSGFTHDHKSPEDRRKFVLGFN